jgi:Alpha-glutamyl/putrescinyl thymine pyrophosphorylase clade 3
MRPKDKERAKRLETRLLEFDSKIKSLPGIKNGTALAVLIEQMVESIRRIEYVHFVRDEQFDPHRADPSSDLFDPIRAAVFRMRRGEIDEAFWLVFLSVHFGKHAKSGWALVRNVYGALGGATWTWARTSANVDRFREWLAANEDTLRKSHFSNHRKYQSLNAYSKVGTGAVVATYVSWVAPPRGHQQMLQDAHIRVGQNPKNVFDDLYKSMKTVMGFGRLARFDFLTMLGKLGLAPIEPGSAYLGGATGPLEGARLLFGGDKKAQIRSRELDALLIQIDSYLDVGMQVLEDSLCNWQKSPRKFISFRG